MANPQITYRGMAHSPAMDERINELAARLDDLHPDLHVPGSEIVATRQLEDTVRRQRGEVKNHKRDNTPDTAAP